jgi:hypothetical protein
MVFAMFQVPIKGGHYFNLNSGAGSLSLELVRSIHKRLLVDPAFYMLNGFEQGNGAAIEFGGPLDKRGKFLYRTFLAGGSGRFAGNIGGTFFPDNNNNFTYSAGAQLWMNLIGYYNRFDSPLLYTPAPTTLSVAVGSKYDQRRRSATPPSTSRPPSATAASILLGEVYGKRELNFGSWQLAYNAPGRRARDQEAPPPRRRLRPVPRHPRLRAPARRRRSRLRPAPPEPGDAVPRRRPRVPVARADVHARPERNKEPSVVVAALRPRPAGLLRRSQPAGQPDEVRHGLWGLVGEELAGDHPPRGHELGPERAGAFEADERLFEREVSLLGVTLRAVERPDLLCVHADGGRVTGREFGGDLGATAFDGLSGAGAQRGQAGAFGRFGGGDLFREGRRGDKSAGGQDRQGGDVGGGAASPGGFGVHAGGH